MRAAFPMLLLAACDPAESEPVALGEAVTTEALMGHLDELQAIADSNGSTRVSGSAGYAGSVEYISDQLEAAGYDVELDGYEVGVYDLASAALTVDGGDFDLGSSDDDGFDVFPFSGAGDVTATAIAVDVDVPPGAEGTSDSGCEEEDYDGFPSGAIAVVQRGSCTFTTKVANAAAGGAGAILIFNEGQPGRTEPFVGSLGDSQVSIPVIAISYAAGAAIAGSIGPVSAHVAVDATYTSSTEYNVLAELPGRNPDRVAMVGAHLDSVAAGPGINDNGSGSALVLEAALQASALEWEPENTVRFAWWGAEESGLVGSWHWVYDEDSEEADRDRLDPIIGYLNYDMVASGNGYRFVYDGTSEGGGSAFIEITEIYEAWFDERELPYSHTPLFIPTDSFWFVAEGVPTGGLYSGASEPMAQGWADAIGGEAGEPLDACYHEDCDIVDNVNPTLFGELGQAGVHAVQVLGEQTDEADTARRVSLDVARPAGCHDHVRWDR